LRLKREESAAGEAESMRLTVSIRKNTSELQFAVDLEPFHLSSGLGDTVLSIRRKKHPIKYLAWFKHDSALRDQQLLKEGMPKEAGVL
jgi:hypothetical protein